MARTVKYLSLNVAGLTNVKRKCRYKFLKKEQTACVCLQETHLKDEEGKWLKQVFNSTIYHASFQTRSKGVMVGIAENVPWETQEVVWDVAGRYVLLKGIWGKKELILGGVHAILLAGSTC